VYAAPRAAARVRARRSCAPLWIVNSSNVRTVEITFAAPDTPLQVCAQFRPQQPRRAADPVESATARAAPGQRLLDETRIDIRSQV
jgi:hypothetical protein